MTKFLFSLLLTGMVLLSAEKLEITADKFIAKDADRQVEFIGHAKVIQGGTSISAPHIVVYFNEDNSTKMYKATEGVKFHIRKKRADYQGSCRTMSYLPRTKQYILQGNVHVKDRTKARDITAAKIEIDTQTGAFTIRGSRKKAAKLIFEMN